MPSPHAARWRLFVALALSTACGASSLAAQARVFSVTVTKDSCLAAPNAPAGYFAILVANKSPDLAQIYLQRLSEVTGFDEYAATIARTGKPVGGLTSIGAPIVAHDSTMRLGTTVELLPGRYALTCARTTRESQGQSKRLQPKEIAIASTPSPIAGRAPTPDLTITLRSSAITLSAGVRPGRRVFRVNNTGPGVHGVILGKLAKDKTLADAERWLVDGKGDRPYALMTGVTGMSAGRSLFLDIELTPGNYFLLCPERDGRFHFQRGMVLEFPVRRG
jgi:hypothetical protein